MSDKTWKAEERRIAEMFGTRRTPLSGQNSGHTGADTLHPTLFIEAKQRAKIPFWTTWMEVRARARTEGKQPILVMHKKGSPDRVAMVDLEWLVGLVQSRPALETLMEELRWLRDNHKPEWDDLMGCQGISGFLNAWDAAKKALGE